VGPVGSPPGWGGGGPQVQVLLRRQMPTLTKLVLRGLASSRLVVSAKSSAAYVNGRPAGICLMRPRFDSGMQS